MPDFLNRILLDDTPPEAIDLIAKLLEFEPQKRLTAEQAMAHPFFDQARHPNGSNKFAQENEVEVIDKKVRK